MERGSDKHGRMLDEALKHETEGLVRSGRSTHAEEWKDPEPSGEDQPDADRAPGETLHGGTPAGMTAQDLEGRSQLAVSLGKESYPLVRAQILDLVTEASAPQQVIDLVNRLPAGRPFANVNEVWAAAGGAVETDRF
jgi:hypothetical protein